MKERIIADTNKKIRNAVDRFLVEKAVGFDTEGSGLDMYVGKTWSIQVGTPKFEILIPINGTPGKYDLHLLDPLFENDKIVKIAHNLAYDTKVMWSLGLNVINGWCTRVGEAVLNAGLYGNNSLAGVIERYFGIKLSKEERKDFYCAEDGKPSDERGMLSKFEASGCKWTPELIDYALGDVEYLVPLMEMQREKLDQEEMLFLVEEIEMPLVEVIARLEYRGVKMDRAACKAYQEEMLNKSKVMRAQLDKEFDVHWKAYSMPLFEKNHSIWERWANEYRDIKKDTNKLRDGENKRKLSAAAVEARAAHLLVQPFKTAPKMPSDININSTSQMIHALEQAGIYLKNLRKETLVEAVAEHPLLEQLVEFKKFKKLSEMSEIYNKINPVTGRIHQNINQNVDTGRISSSGPNLTNIPARAEEGERFRKLFIAEEGNTFIVADYSAIELVIIGIRSRDKNLLHALDNDLDLHCWTMSKFLDVNYEHLVKIKENKEKKEARESDFTATKAARARFEQKFNLPELSKCSDDKSGIEKWVKTFRDYVKTLTYGIAYGLSSFGLSRRFHCDVNEAQRFIDVFFEVYPDIKRWLDRQSAFGEKNGYSKTASGRRRYYRRPHKPERQDIVDEANKILKQQDRDALSMSKEEIDELWDQVKKRLWREYKQTVNRIRRQAANHPVQGGSADITKFAMLFFEQWWIPYAKKNKINYFKFGIVLTVHDELVLEVPTKHSKIAGEKLKWAMETAAKEFLGYGANIVVKPIFTPFWKK